MKRILFFSIKRGFLRMLLFYMAAVRIFPLGLTIPGLSGGSSAKAGAGGFSMDLLWSGAWDYEGSLINRGDIRLRVHKPALLLRVQAVDKRPAPPDEEFADGLSAFSGGLYHGTTGSRLLYGILDEEGLPARIKNVWNRGMPFVEQHQPTIADLRTEPSSTKVPVTYLWLGSPQLGPLRGFGSILLDADNQAAFDGGLEARLGRGSTLRAEGFYTRNLLPPKSPSAWFSETPPLPERGSDVFAGNIYFNTEKFAATADLAYTETFAYGQDMYGNLAFRIGNKPWRLALAADMAGKRYTGRDGSATGPGFRAAARLERRGKRSSLFRVSTTLRSVHPGERFYRSTSLFYYHFPTPAPRASPFFWPSRVSLTISREASNPEKILDTVEAITGFNLWKIPLTLQGNLSGLCSAGDYAYDFDSAKLSAEGSYSLKPFDFSTRLVCHLKKEKLPQWAPSLSISARGKWGRITVKAGAGDFPRDWNLGLSWRVQM
jgi:hypothetical protein